MLRKTLLFALCMMIVGCSTSLMAPLPQQAIESRLFVVTQLQPTVEKSLLAIQFQPQQWRWVQTDPLGAPIARMLLTQQGWRNDGFVMPNKQAKTLFSAITTFLVPEQSLFSFSKIELTPMDKRYFINGKPVWWIEPMKEGIKIYLTDNSSEWLIEELK